MCRVYHLGFKVWGFGFTFQGLDYKAFGFRVKGSESRVLGF